MIFRSLNPLSVTASQNLRKIYTQLQLSSKEDKKIPVKAITKLFAQSKDDRKLVERALDQSGLPCGKGDEISRSSFTFDQFKVLAKNLNIRFFYLNPHHRARMSVMLEIVEKMSTNFYEYGTGTFLSQCFPRF